MTGSEATRTFGISSFLPREAGRVDPVARVPRPSHLYYLPSGEIYDARRILSSPHSSAPRKPASAAQRAGKRYERFATSRLVELAGPCTVHLGPWYRYVDGSAGARFCQPDLVLELPSCTLVVEAKSSAFGLVDAWWQLFHLYLPVLRRAAERGVPLVPLAVCRSFDPAVALPAEASLINSLQEATPGRFNVMVVR